MATNDGAPPWLAEMFHAFPHMDFDFYNTTTIFSPSDASYLQALMFNGIIVFFVSVTFFLISTIYYLVCSCYFCSSCHPPLKPKPARSRCLRLLISLFAFLSCLALGTGFYGNDKTKTGVDNFSSAANDIYNTWDLFKLEDTVLRQFLTSGSNSTLMEIEKGLEDSLSNTSLPAINKLYNVIDLSLVQLNDAKYLIDDSDADFQTYSSNAMNYESKRWWSTVGILCWHLLLVIVVFYAAWGERRCPFVCLTIMAVLSLFFMMTSISFEVPLSVGAADLCINPKDAAYASIDSPTGVVVLKYYLECESNSTNPLLAAFMNLSDILKPAKILVAELEADPLVQMINNSKVLLNQLQSSFDYAEIQLNKTNDVLDCTYINQRFKDGISEVCHAILNGFGLYILSAMIISLFLICVLLCITPIWKAMARLRSILRKPNIGVHIITSSYSGPPGESHDHGESTGGDTSMEASYKSLQEDEHGFEHLPLLSGKNEPPPQYAATQGSGLVEFLSVEEDRKPIIKDTEA